MKNTDLKEQFPFHPIRVELNLTELCNLRCDFCPRAYDYPNRNLHMSEEMFDLFLDSHMEFTAEHRAKMQIMLIGRGEPTLHPQFTHFIDKLFAYHMVLKRRFGFTIGLTIHTNGRKWEDWIPEYYKCFSKIDFNCYSDRTYLEYLDLKEQMKKYPNVLVQDRGVTGRNEPKEEVRKSFKRGETKVYYNNRAGSIPDNAIPLKTLEETHNVICHKPFDVIYLDWDGTWRICCNDWGNPLEGNFGEDFGNIQDISISDHIWRNPKMNEYRWRLLKGDRSLTPCDKCNAVPPPDMIDGYQELFTEIYDRKPIWKPDHLD